MLVHTYQSSLFEAELPNDLHEVRAVSKAFADFLRSKNFHERECNEWELVMVEAVNNAVLHPREETKHLPIRLKAFCTDTHLQLSIYDSTAGFDWPDQIELPDPDSEHGRGLFLIKNLVDECRYFRSKNGNCLELSRKRALAENKAVSSTPSMEELETKLQETESILQSMGDELTASYESLAAIFRFTSELSRPHNTSQFSDNLLAHLLQVTEAQVYVLRINNSGDLRLFSSSNYDVKVPSLSLNSPMADSSIEVKAALNREDIWFDSQNTFSKEDPLATLFVLTHGLVHPIFLEDKIVGTLAIARPLNRPAFTAGQVNVIHTFADFLAMQIINERLQEEQVRNKLIARELEIARNIQRSLLPEHLPQLTNCSLAGYSESARQVGGDFFDCWLWGEDSLVMIIADVMGKGVPAALFAAILRSISRSNPDLSPHPGVLLGWINELIYRDLDRVDMFITTQVIFLNTRSNIIRTASAGHCPSLIAMGDKHSLQEISADGLPLGLNPRCQYQECEIILQKPFQILIYTDGITECRAPDNQFLGTKRLIDFLADCSQKHKNAEKIKHELIEFCHRFQAGNDASDDMTFFVITSP